jgi:hypothetical protein
MGSTNQYWHYARQCRELAAMPANKAYRECMLAMAEKWRRLALGDTGVLDATEALDDTALHEPKISGTSEPLRRGSSGN